MRAGAAASCGRTLRCATYLGRSMLMLGEVPKGNKKPCLVHWYFPLSGKQEKCGADSTRLFCHWYLLGGVVNERSFPME